MDVSGILEGNKITAEYINTLAFDEREGIIRQSEDTKGEYGKYPKMEVELKNGKVKYWNMSKASIEEFAKDHGTDSDGWVGLRVRFTVINLVTGKKSLLGKPA